MPHTGVWGMALTPHFWARELAGLIPSQENTPGQIARCLGIPQGRAGRFGD
jgi:hypothetical protein